MHVAGWTIKVEDTHRIMCKNVQRPADVLNSPLEIHSLTKCSSVGHIAQEFLYIPSIPIM